MFEGIIVISSFDSNGDALPGPIDARVRRRSWFWAASLSACDAQHVVRPSIGAGRERGWEANSEWQPTVLASMHALVRHPTFPS
jgi:hypothetical protein